tara:strand:- start:366 stop:929 length:564 start_codon:yes stop_codon:yes gene_type:complete
MSSLSFCALDAAMRDPALRKRCIEALSDVTKEEAIGDGGKFLTFAKIARIADVALDDARSNPSAAVIATFKELGCPVSQHTKRREFERVAVSQHYYSNSNNGDSSTTHVRHMNSQHRKQTDPAGLTWFAYVGNREAVIHVVKDAKNTLAIPEDRIRVAFGKYLEICFLDPALSPEADEGEDEDDDDN